MPRSKRRQPTVIVARCFVLRADGLILLIQRAETDSLAGLWECPGGTLDGQSFTTALKREIREETGLRIGRLSEKVFRNETQIRSGKRRGHRRSVSIAIAKARRGRVRRSKDHDNHVWVTYDQLITYELTTETRKAANVLKSLLLESSESMKTRK
jgi:8-oxo-dGTP pyrophosphatase MutT (NUDIX family)